MLTETSTAAGSPAGTDGEVVSPFVLFQAVRGVTLREEDMTVEKINETFKVLNVPSQYLLNNSLSHAAS